MNLSVSSPAFCVLLVFVFRLDIQEALFFVQSSSVTDHVPVGADDAMAGDDDGDRVFVIREANSSIRIWISDLFGNISIGSGFTVGYVLESFPHADLKGSSLQCQRDGKGLSRAG